MEQVALMMQETFSNFGRKFRGMKRRRQKYNITMELTVETNMV
jgi:hypothetical protein